MCKQVERSTSYEACTSTHMQVYTRLSYMHGSHCPRVVRYQKRGRRTRCVAKRTSNDARRPPHNAHPTLPCPPAPRALSMPQKPLLNAKRGPHYGYPLSPRTHTFTDHPLLFHARTTIISPTKTFRSFKPASTGSSRSSIRSGPSTGSAPTSTSMGASAKTTPSTIASTCASRCLTS
jgi:hypothetical protein